MIYAYAGRSTNNKSIVQMGWKVENWRDQISHFQSQFSNTIGIIVPDNFQIHGYVGMSLTDVFLEDNLKEFCPDENWVRYAFSAKDDTAFLLIAVVDKLLARIGMSRRVERIRLSSANPRTVEEALDDYLPSIVFLKNKQKALTRLENRRAV